MRNRSAFTQPTVSNPMDPEYVKLQRKEVLKQYQDQILAKKAELKAIEDRRTGLEAEISIAFADRLALVESKEKASSERENKTNAERGAFIANREAYELDAASREKKIQDRRDEVLRLIEKNERVLSQINLRTGAIDQDQKTAQDLTARLNAFEEELNQRQASLEKDASLLETKKGEVTAENSSLLELRNAVSIEKETLAVSRLANEKQLTDMAGLRDRLKQIKKETDETLEVLRIERAENDRVYKANVDMAKQFKSRQKELDDLDAKLRTWEADLTNTKNDLDTREERVKNLEKKISPKIGG